MSPCWSDQNYIFFFGMQYSFSSVVHAHGEIKKGLIIVAANPLFRYAFTVQITVSINCSTNVNVLSRPTIHISPLIPCDVIPLVHSMHRVLYI